MSKKVMMSRSIHSAKALLSVWFLCLIFFLKAASYPSSLFGYEPALEIALQKLPQGSLHIVPNKIDFMREISSKEDCEDSFHCIDLASLVDRMTLWKKHLPRVTPFYAVKTNHDPMIVAVLAALGTGFDCASKREIMQVQQLNVDSTRIIFAHPRKPTSEILYAQKSGVTLTTFDSIEELNRLVRLYPDGQYVLRIATDDSHSLNKLSTKFGAALDEAYHILDYAFQNGIEIKGIAFHVGSNCTHLESYIQALTDAKNLFQYSRDIWGKKLTLLDLGGGWPGNDDAFFITASSLISDFLDTHFDEDVQIIAEPGRYFATKTTTAALRVIGKKTIDEGSQKTISYYMSNGVYGFFISTLYYNYDQNSLALEGWNFSPLKTDGHKAILYPSVLWGPTCDCVDKIMDGVVLPEMESGDFLYSENVGAYTSSLQNNFNQICPSRTFYIYDLSTVN